MTQGNDGDGSIRSYVQFFRRRYRNRPAVADDRQSVAGGEQAVDIKVQVSPAAIGFTAIARLDINILDMLNRSRGDIACTLIDVTCPLPPTVVDEISRIEGVLRVRLL